MVGANPRHCRVVYVAGSVRELPAELQSWLSRPEVRATASPHIYDALAMLSLRRRPAVLIVPVEQVDWNEMEFFELAARLSPSTHIYVTATTPGQEDKLAAARSRGAELLDLRALEEEALQGRPEPSGMSTREVFLDTRRAVRETLPVLAPLPPLEEEVTAPPPSVGVVPAGAEPASTTQAEEKAASSERQGETTPQVRLVTPRDSEEDLADETDEAASDVPFPWAPSPLRPKRTPPPVHGAAPPPPPSSPLSPQEKRPDTAPSARRPAGPVELTAEELAALVGKVHPPPRPKESSP